MKKSLKQHCDQGRVCVGLSFPPHLPVSVSVSVGAVLVFFLVWLV